MKAALKLLDVFKRLPVRQRTEVALALSDLANDLLAVEPDPLDAELTELARLERELRDCEPAERRDLITTRLDISRATYFRRLNKLRTIRQSQSLTKAPIS